MSSNDVLTLTFATRGPAINAQTGAPVAIHLDTIEAITPSPEGTTIRTLSGAIYNVTAKYEDILADMVGELTL